MPRPAARVAPATRATLPSSACWRPRVVITGVYSFVSDDHIGDDVTGQELFSSYENAGAVIAVDLVNELALEHAFGRPVESTDPFLAIQRVLAIDPPSAAQLRGRDVPGFM